MRPSAKHRSFGVDKALCVAGVAACAVAGVWWGLGGAPSEKSADSEGGADYVAPDFARLDAAIAASDEGRGADSAERRLFASALRVVAVGSGFPIPYDAATCPFTGAEQPSLNQMDRDADGITDDWELRYGLDRYDASDADEDPDDDRFTNREEFLAGTHPLDPESRPAYATKLRFVKRIDAPFPLVFQGFTHLGNGGTALQLNVPQTGKTLFAEIGETVEGVVLERFVEGEIGDTPRLFVSRRGREIELPRGETVLDPESKAELINILDRSTKIVTMGPLLSLYSDRYAVLGIHEDRVVLLDVETDEVYDVVGLAEGER